MTDRANSKHGPRLDEQLAQEVRGYLQGSPGTTRSESWREAEPPADGEPEPTLTPLGHHGVDTGDDRDPDYRDERALIGSYLPRSVFPADREGLLNAAQSGNAPDTVLTMLGRLGNGQTFENAHELWDALDLASSPRF